MAMDTLTLILRLLFCLQAHCLSNREGSLVSLKANWVGSTKNNFLIGRYSDEDDLTLTWHP